MRKINLVGLVAASILIVACSTGRATRPESGDTETAATKAAIADAYLAYWDARIASIEHPDPDDPSLALTATGEELERLKATATKFRAAGATGSYDYWESEVQTITVDGDTAELIDCHRETLAVRLRVTTKSVESSDDAPARLQVTLKQEESGWKVNAILENGLCA